MEELTVSGFGYTGHAIYKDHLIFDLSREFVYCTKNIENKH